MRLCCTSEELRRLQFVHEELAKDSQLNYTIQNSYLGTKSEFIPLKEKKKSSWSTGYHDLMKRYLPFFFGLSTLSLARDSWGFLWVKIQYFQLYTGAFAAGWIGPPILHDPESSFGFIFGVSLWPGIRIFFLALIHIASPFLVYTCTYRIRPQSMVSINPHWEYSDSINQKWTIGTHFTYKT